MQKKKVFKIEDSNIEGIGTDADKKCRESAAATEKAWKKVKKGKPGFYCWRIEKFKVKKNNMGLDGKLFNDDSYIFLNGYEDENKKLLWDVHFWLGTHTSQDEAGTAAYKTVELDDFLGGDPIQHREVSGHESSMFLSYFKDPIRLLEGGVDSGFNVVKPTEYVPRLLWIKGKKRIRVQQVDIKIANLNSGDAFVLDAGLNIYIFHAQYAGFGEKTNANTLAGAIDDERGGKPERYIFSQTDSYDDIMGQFFSYFEGDLPEDSKIAPGEEVGEEIATDLMSKITTDKGGSDAAWEKKSDKILFVLSDEDGKLEFTEVAKGKDIVRDMLSSDDVNIFDVGNEVFVHIGSGASDGEKKNGMKYAGNYLQDYGRPAFLPITQIYEGGTNKIFDAAFN